jgi:pimeloyl-ACP methyl ester carboxylesterase
MQIASLLMLLGLLVGCATRDDVHAPDLEPGRLPAPDTTLAIAGLGPCTDNPDRRLHVAARQPVTVLVHGCFGSSGQFRALAQVLAFHGQQSACFTYDDRARLDDSAAGLRRALRQLAGPSAASKIDVIGHSQGALVARRALTDELPAPLPEPPAELRLVTVSGPFSGIEAARTCGRRWLYPLSLGLLPLSCLAATGPKWADITFSSPFILEPGALSPRVSQHLKIDTDERGSCRPDADGRCIDSDDTFSLAEQRSPVPDADPRVVRVEVAAGHVEIVGDKRVAPTKLIKVLQQQGVLQPTAPQRQAAFDRLLARLYGNAAGR